MAALEQLVATGSADKTVRVWSTGGEERRVLAGHKKRVGGTISPPALTTLRISPGDGGGADGGGAGDLLQPGRHPQDLEP